MKSKILDKLNELGIDYKIYKHNPVFTCNEAKELDISGVRVKSLLLRNKRADKYYMVVLRDEEKLNSNHLRKLLQESKISFASEERMIQTIGVKPGHVSPFALINNKEKNVEVIFNKSLQDVLIGFHPGRNDFTIVLRMEDVEKFLNNLGFSYRYFAL